MKLNLYTLFFLASLTVMLFAMDTNAFSCMGGRGGCMSSCMVQNCATGYCNPPGAEAKYQTCSCSRCGVGPISLPVTFNF
jgi:hypothetical protein